MANLLNPPWAAQKHNTQKRLDLREDSEEQMKVLSEMTREEQKRVHNPGDGIQERNARLRSAPFDLDDNGIAFARYNSSWAGFTTSRGRLGAVIYLSSSGLQPQIT